MVFLEDIFAHFAAPVINFLYLFLRLQLVVPELVFWTKSGQGMSLSLLCCLNWCLIPVKMVAFKYKLARSAG